MSSNIIDYAYYFWGVKDVNNEDDGLFYFCSKSSVLKKLAEQSTAGIAGWTFSESDYCYGMTRELYQPLANYLSKVVGVGSNLTDKGTSGPLPVTLINYVKSGYLLSRPERVAINTGIKNKVNNKWIYALCIHRDCIHEEKYSTYLGINRREKDIIVRKMVDKNACYFMYNFMDDKLPESFHDAIGEAPPSFYGKIYEMAININNLTIDDQKSILGKTDHFYEHMDRIPRGLRPDCIDDACINRVNINSNYIKNDNRIDNRDKKERIKEQRIRDFKRSCPQESQELFELRMEKVIHQAIERVKRNPRLAIPYGLNDTNKTALKDMLSLGQFVIPLYNEGEAFLGLTLRCKINQSKVKETTNRIIEKDKKGKKIGRPETEEIVSFRECTYSADTILPLPIVRMNVLPYVDCDVSNLWCFNNH